MPAQIVVRFGFGVLDSCSRHKVRHNLSLLESHPAVEVTASSELSIHAAELDGGVVESAH